MNTFLVAVKMLIEREKAHSKIDELLVSKKKKCAVGISQFHFNGYGEKNDDEECSFAPSI